MSQQELWVCNTLDSDVIIGIYWHVDYANVTPLEKHAAKPGEWVSFSVDMTAFRIGFWEPTGHVLLQSVAVELVPDTKRMGFVAEAPTSRFVLLSPELQEAYSLGGPGDIPKPFRPVAAWGSVLQYAGLGASTVGGVLSALDIPGAGALSALASVVKREGAMPSINDISIAITTVVRDKSIRDHVEVIQSVDYEMDTAFDVAVETKKPDFLRGAVGDVLRPTSPFLTAMYSLQHNLEFGTHGGLPALAKGASLWAKMKMFEVLDRREQSEKIGAMCGGASKYARGLADALDTQNDATERKLYEDLMAVTIPPGQLRNRVRDGAIAKHFWGDARIGTSRARDMRGFADRLEAMGG